MNRPIMNHCKTLLPGVALALAAMAMPGLLWAQPGSDRDPCGASASTEARDQARELAKQAFALHQALQLEKAARAYRQALRHWDYPEIRFALSRVLYNDARVLEAHEHVRAALRCPQELESDEERNQARKLLQRLQTQLVEIEVHSPDADTAIEFNGSPWFEGADAAVQSKTVYPGQYVITARRRGYVPVSKPLELAANQKATIKPELVSIADATTIERRWARWQPWAVTGAGAAVALLGGGLLWKAARDFDTFDKRWGEDCSQAEPPAGCSENDKPGVVGIRNRAQWEQRIAVGSFIAGGAAFVAGVAMVMLNRPRAFIDDSVGSATLNIVPIVSRDGAGISTRYSF